MAALEMRATHCQLRTLIAFSAATPHMDAPYTSRHAIRNVSMG